MEIHSPCNNWRSVRTEVRIHHASRFVPFEHIQINFPTSQHVQMDPPINRLITCKAWIYRQTFSKCIHTNKFWELMNFLNLLPVFFPTGERLLYYRMIKLLLGAHTRVSFILRVIFSLSHKKWKMKVPFGRHVMNAVSAFTYLTHSHTILVIVNIMHFFDRLLLSDFYSNPGEWLLTIRKKIF